MKSHFIPHKHSTSHPESRTPLILSKLKDNSELPDSVWFLKASDYFKQPDVRRSTSTGFAFDYNCLNLSQHEAFGELGKKRSRCEPWQLEEHSRPDSPRLSPQNPNDESSHLLARHQGILHSLAPTPVSSPLLLWKTKGVLGANRFGCLHYSGISGDDFFFSLPKLVSLPGELLKNSVPGFWFYPLLKLLKIPSLCHCINHTHSAGHRTVKLEEVGCSILNYIPSKIHYVLSSKYFKNSCKQRASVNKAAQ